MIALTVNACSDNPDRATVTLQQPADGDTLAGGIALRMAAEGITIEEAGVARDGAGHFHVTADSDCVQAGTAIPRDIDHVHFGDGRSDGTIYLGPGTHQLCLQAGDGAHVALEPIDTVTVTVEIASTEEWCAVISEVGQLFETVDTTDEPFAIKQQGYGNVRRLFAQLAAGTVHLDDEIRPAVEADIAFGDSIARAFTEATDPDDAQAALAGIDQGPLVAEGVTAISETCDVNLGG